MLVKPFNDRRMSRINKVSTSSCGVEKSQRKIAELLGPSLNAKESLVVVAKESEKCGFAKRFGLPMWSCVDMSRIKYAK